MSGILKVGDKVKYKSHSHGVGEGVAVGVITGIEIRYFINGTAQSIGPHGIIEKLPSSSSSSSSSCSSEFSSTTS
jgi:hypothetical protein